MSVSRNVSSMQEELALLAPSNCTKAQKTSPTQAFSQIRPAQLQYFVRFSTVVGSRGSADTVRDVRGFAVKFYTEEGNWDIVGNDIPVFFVQDAMKFPDLGSLYSASGRHVHADISDSARCKAGA